MDVTSSPCLMPGTGIRMIFTKWHYQAQSYFFRPNDRYLLWLPVLGAIILYSIDTKHFEESKSNFVTFPWIIHLEKQVLRQEHRSETFRPFQANRPQKGDIIGNRDVSLPMKFKLKMLLHTYIQIYCMECCFSWIVWFLCL